MSLRGINLKHNYFGYKNNLNGVHIECNDGQFIVIYGGSNSGKSSLLKVLSGLDKPNEGSVEVDNVNIQNIKKKDRNLSLTLEQDSFFSWRSVYYNLKYPLKIRGYKKREIIDRVENAIESVGINGIVYYPARMLQEPFISKVKIARAILRDAKYFLFDNPFRYLSTHMREEVFYELIQLIENLKGGVIYATDSIEEVFYLNKQTYILNKGLIVAEGSIKDIIENFNNIEIAEIFKNKFFNIINIRENFKFIQIINNKLNFDETKISEIDSSCSNIIEDSEFIIDENAKSMVIPYNAIKKDDKGMLATINSLKKLQYGYLISVKIENITLYFNSEYSYNIGDNIKISLNKDKIKYFI